MLTGNVWLWMTALVLLGVRTRAGHEAEGVERTARPERAGSRRCVVNQVRALQMEIRARRDIRLRAWCCVPRVFSTGGIPLLDVLRRARADRMP